MLKVETNSQEHKEEDNNEMAIVEIAGGIIFAPFVSILVLILMLASFGKSFGIRKLYVQFLVKIFEVSE